MIAPCYLQFVHLRAEGHTVSFFEKPRFCITLEFTLQPENACVLPLKDGLSRIQHSDDLFAELTQHPQSWILLTMYVWDFILFVRVVTWVKCWEYI